MNFHSTSPTVTIVIPAKNEAANLREVLPLLPLVHEVLLVDGHSVDETIEVARQTLPGIRIVQQTRRGKGNALVCGFLAATGDIIVMFDADGSADPTEIPAYVKALTNGADFAKGSRFAPGGGSDDITVIRRFGNAGLHMLANLAFGTRFSDLCYGYNAFWRDLLPILDLPSVDTPGPADGSMIWGDGFEIETILNCRIAAAGVRVAEVPSIELRRIHGKTNLRTFPDGSRVLRTIVAERRRIGSGRRQQDCEVARLQLTPRVDLDLGWAPSAALAESGLANLPRELESSADEKHAESVVVGSAEDAGDVAVQFDEAVDGFGTTIVSPFGGGVVMETSFTTRGLMEPFDLRNQAGQKHGQNLLGDGGFVGQREAV